MIDRFLRISYFLLFVLLLIKNRKAEQ